MCKRLPRLRVHNQEGGNVVVEEDTRNAACTVRDLETELVLLVTSREVTPELGRAVLVGVDNPIAKSPELCGDNLEEVLEHEVVLRSLGKARVNMNGHQ